MITIVAQGAINRAPELVEKSAVGVAHSRFLRMLDLSWAFKAEHFVKKTQNAPPLHVCIGFVGA